MAICTKCERIDVHVHVEDLEPDECYALAFAQAMVAGKGSPAFRGFFAGEGRIAKDMNERERKRRRQRGLHMLADRGVVKLKRSALAGEYEVESYDGSKLVGGNIISGDFS